EFSDARIKKLPEKIIDELGFKLESYSFNKFGR
ncbi:MAG: transcriptional repressor, partial [Ignavibacteriae bacterium]